MKKILAIVAAVALVAVGVVGTLAFQRAFEPSVKLTATSIQEQLTNSSELATAKLEYRGLVRYENGDIDFINKKGFTMVYDAEVRAGVDLSQASVDVSGRTVTVRLPQARLLGIEIDPHSIEFYDSAFALFNWENKQDTAEALKAAQADAEGKVDQTGMIEQANEQARTLVENLLHPFTVGEGAYTLQIVGQRGMNETVASLIMSLESAIAVIAGWLLLGEVLSQRELFGCVLMAGAVVLAQLPAPKSRRSGKD